MVTPIEEARRLAGWGLNVLPAAVGGNHPQIEWKPYQEQRTDSKLAVWFAGDRPRDYWIATGLISGCAVLDCDNQEAVDYWRAKLGAEVLENTPTAKTKRGRHYYFKLDQPMRSWSVHPEDGQTGPSFDVRADKTGVIAPPSQNKTWERSPDDYSMEPVPAELQKPAEEFRDQAGGGARSMLTQLLENPGKGGYNNWFTRVCGHYAKEYSTRRDAYEYHCWEAYAKLDHVSGGDAHPKPDAIKTLEQIWGSEQAKETDRRTVKASAGFLVSGGAVILTQVAKSVGKGDEKVVEYELDEWADFDLKATGVVEDHDVPRVYSVELTRSRHGDTIATQLPARVCADPRLLTGWLAQFGVSIGPPENISPKMLPFTTRLGRYLESQNPPHFRVVDHLGWHDDGFVVHEGVIQADGLHPHLKVRPATQLSNWAPYRYGTSHTPAETRAVLNEILTFHDETVCSVFGAWWIACILKPQIMRVSSQFPFMALEAASESGKTTGFFSLMLSLAGNTQGNVNPTRAALRDYMSAHQSGIVWIDDLDDPNALFELLRQATGEGSVTKKGDDHEQVVAELVAPISISGEALNLSGQKALADRAVQLQVPSPTQRRSLRDPAVAQWVDVVALKARVPDLTEYAGTLVQMVLAHAALVESLPTLVPPAGGRFGDKVGILRLGAHLLAAVTGNEDHIDRVDAWVANLDDVGHENALTLRLLPTALAQTEWRATAMSTGDGRWPATPALVVDDLVWFSPALLAQWWDTFKNGRVEMRTDSRDALEAQARALGLGGNDGRKRFNINGDRNRKVWYWGLTPELSATVLARSRGEEAPRRVEKLPEAVRASFRMFTSMDLHEDPDE
jgi:hypothetical protein